MLYSQKKVLYQVATVSLGSAWTYPPIDGEPLLRESAPHAHVLEQEEVEVAPVHVLHRIDRRAGREQNVNSTLARSNKNLGSSTVSVARYIEYLFYPCTMLFIDLGWAHLFQVSWHNVLAGSLCH